MANVLYLKANPKPDNQSVTFQMSEHFMAQYRQKNPGDVVTTLDLYQKPIRFLQAQDLEVMFSGADFDVKRAAQQFAAADKYVIAAPFWNLSVPAILKAYIDYVSFAGVTFRYTEQGSVGMLSGQGKKAVHLVARGGAYATPEMQNYELGDRYLRTIFGFFGITDFQTIACEQTAVLQGEALQQAVDAAVKQAGELAQEF